MQVTSFYRNGLAMTLAIAFVFLCSSGQAFVDPDIQDYDYDEVVLLQTQVEMKKNQALLVNSADEWQDDAKNTRDAIEASCSQALDLDVQNLPTPMKEMVWAGDATHAKYNSNANAFANDSNFVADIETSSIAIVGTILKMMACALLMDMLRRFIWKPNRSTSTSEKLTPEDSCTRSHVKHLLSAALASDDQAFEANFLGNQHELLEVDTWDCTALHYAAKGGSVHIISRILDLGAKVDAIDAWDETPLHMAARAGCAAACARLLKAGANINALNAQDHTPLIVAGLAAQEASCKLLVEQGGGAGGLTDEEIPNLVARLLLANVLTAGFKSSAA